LVKKGNLLTLKKHHAAIGFRLLLDEHIEIEKDGEKIILAGVENWGKGFGERGDLQKALAHTQFGDFKVLLSHDPSHWDEEVKNHPSKIQLTLSGHTHGMQFGIEAFGLKWSPVKYRYPHWAGLKEEFGRFLYVNRGFGFIGFSGRVGIWPEVTVIELRGSK
jgi:predicted MPP superfamily phosphohydrolase